MDGVSSLDEPLDFEEWYAREHARLYAALLVVTGDPHLAEDATDEALARTLHHWKRVREMDSPGGWTYRVAVNIVRRTARRRAIERRVLARLAADPVVPAPAGEVWDLVRSLTKRQRMAIALRYIADLTEPDIATIMGVTRGTVASTLADARHSLAEILSEPDVVEETS